MLLCLRFCMHLYIFKSGFVCLENEPSPKLNQNMKGYRILAARSVIKLLSPWLIALFHPPQLPSAGRGDTASSAIPAGAPPSTPWSCREWPARTWCVTTPCHQHGTASSSATAPGKCPPDVSRSAEPEQLGLTLPMGGFSSPSLSVTVYPVGRGGW